ncbi:phospholipase effector Tle1 domain-containing protein [Pseudomonas fragi]|uniref:phospholipase effector Tle1 domain-containing protein n=1 Tax=Pseudomonas fragi TaxID=296 RepID=UPI001F31CC38|nr:DUF2235 domain-containing protein [Pseudomonas fragi]MCF6760441.1 DUF2235 domain-containing protein [Pseudomonas fragi]
MSHSSNTGYVLRVGIFFDGTANNQFNILSGRERQALGIKVDPDSSYAGVPTNIARLHRHYPVQTAFKDAQALTSLYVGGIGTTTGADDTSFPGLTYGRGRTGVLGKADEALVQLSQCLEQFVRLAPANALSRLQLDLFGFSRGAAAARHFANQVHATAFAQQFALASDFKCSIEFIGLFDTVAAMGGLQDLGDVGDEINPGLNLYLGPDCAQQVVQLCARDEHRRNFSLTRIAPQWPLDISLPGAHADLGGGYPLEMQEQVQLTRWQSNLVSPSTPIRLTSAWKLAQAQLLEWQARDLIDPLAAQDSVQVRTEEQMAGSRQDPMKRVQAAVFMQRQVLGHLSRVYLRIMHSLACKQGVPFTALDSVQDALPDELLPIAARLEGQVLKGTIKLTAAQERLLRQRYVHQSANFNANVGQGLGVLDKAFFNIAQEGGRAVYGQKPPV